MCNLPNRPKLSNAKAVKEQEPTLDDLIDGTSHVIYSSCSRVGCARCHSSFLIKDPSLKFWLKRSCEALGSTQDRPVHIPYDEVHLGNRVTHVTHDLYKFQGLVYCNRCGCNGTQKLHKLSEACQPPTSYGKACLKLLRQGKMPR